MIFVCLMVILLLLYTCTAQAAVASRFIHSTVYECVRKRNSALWIVYDTNRDLIYSN